MPSQNRETATLSTEESFFRTLLTALPSYQQRGVCVGGGRQEKEVNVILTDSPSLVLSAQPDLHTAKRVYCTIFIIIL